MLVSISGLEIGGCKRYGYFWPNQTDAAWSERSASVWNVFALFFGDRPHPQNAAIFFNMQHVLEMIFILWQVRQRPEIIHILQTRVIMRVGKIVQISSCSLVVLVDVVVIISGLVIGLNKQIACKFGFDNCAQKIPLKIEVHAIRGKYWN